MKRRRCSRLVPMLASLLAGCPDDPPPSGEGTGSSSSDSEPGSSSSSSDTMTPTSASSTSLDPSSSSTVDPDTGTTGESLCVDGTWTGVYHSGFETSAFTPCEGEPAGTWWFDPPIGACGSAVVTITGNVCGPGTYGHLGGYSYQVYGSIEGDPCLPADCDAAPLECGPFEALCGIAECSLDQQDCPGNEKCVPTSTDGLPPWTETACVPVVREPLEAGEPCTIDAPGDDCGFELWCIPDAPGSTTGECVRFCNAAGVCGGIAECVSCNAEPLVAFGVCGPPSCEGQPDCPGAC